MYHKVQKKSLQKNFLGLFSSSQTGRASLVAAAALVTLLATTSAAQAEGLIVPFAGFNYGGDSANCLSLTACEDKHLNAGVSIGGQGAVFGAELEVAFAKDFFGAAPGADSSVLTVMSNLSVGLPLGPVRPFVVGGIGLIRPHVALTLRSLAASSNTLGYDVGGGVAVFPVRRLGVRADLRHFRTLQDVTLLVFKPQALEFWRASAGLAFRF